MRRTFALTAVADSALALLGKSRARKVSKTALIPALAVERPPSSAGPALGLAGSWLGDIVLLRSDNRAFLLGLSSFLGGHLAYTASFASRGERSRLLHLLPLAAVTAATAVTFGRMADPLRRPVQAYALAIGTMAAAATTLRGPGSGRVIAGASTFIASDTLLALGRFAFPAKWARLTDTGVMATYTLGQWLIHDGLREHDTAAERP